MNERWWKRIIMEQKKREEKIKGGKERSLKKGKSRRKRKEKEGKKKEREGRNKKSRGGMKNEWKWIRMKQKKKEAIKETERQGRNEKEKEGKWRKDGKKGRNESRVCEYLNIYLSHFDRHFFHLFFLSFMFVKRNKQAGIIKLFFFAKVSWRP